MATNKTKTALVSEVGSSLPINTSGQLTTTGLNTFALNLIESLFGITTVTTVTAASPTLDLDVTRYLRCDTTSNSVTVSLPDATANAGRTCTFKKVVAANNMILTPAGSDTIQQLDASFSTSLTIPGIGACISFVAVGTTWEITSIFIAA